MGQEVFVLMSLEGNSRAGKEWRPVAVVTDPAVAEQWVQAGKDVDWVPLELDDVKHMSPGEKQPEFRPTPKKSPLMDRAIETAKRLEDTNGRLLKIIEQLQKRLGIKKEKQVQERSQPAVK